MQDLIGLPELLQSISVYLLLLMLSLRIGLSVASPFLISHDPSHSSYSIFNCSRLGNNEPREFPDLQILMGASLLPIVFQEVFVGLVCGMVLSLFSQ